MDTAGALLARRIVELRGRIDDTAATDAIAKLLYLESVDRTALAHLHIDSVGGEVSAVLAIRDTMDELSCPVATHCLGEASGVAVALLAHGARDSRSAALGARIAFAPISSNADERRLTALIVEMISRDSGTAAQQVEQDLRASRRLDAAQAHSYGLIDRIDR